MAKKLDVKKPPTQTAGVSGFDAFEAKPDEEFERVDWRKLINLPSFEMFVYEQSGQRAGESASAWVRSRRAMISDATLYEQYELWHKSKGLWLNETPMGKLISEG